MERRGSLKASFRKELPVLAAIFFFWVSMYTYPSFFSAYVSDRLLAPGGDDGLIVGAYGFAQMNLPHPAGHRLGLDAAAQAVRGIGLLRLAACLRGPDADRIAGLHADKWASSRMWWHSSPAAFPGDGGDVGILFRALFGLLRS